MVNLRPMRRGWLAAWWIGEEAPDVSQRAAELFREHQQRIFARTDALFAWLMILQWLAGIAAACWISPRTWSGTSSAIHPHFWAALFLGGAVTGYPVFLALRHPGKARYAIAVAQMLMSATLIHLTGGRIETHFHVFGSLAFLAFYRDWRVFIPATAVVAADHMIRGLYFPQSVFGVATAESWRWLEHAGWVLFEDAFLIIACRQSVREMWDMARQQAQLEETKDVIEAEVAERTAALATLQKQHLEVARRVGMAEIATSVLHNVGNVLNSVNVAASVIGEKLKHSGTGDLQRATGLLQQHLDDPGAFIGSDARGRHLPQFLIELGRKMAADEEQILAEVVELSRSIDHIKDIVTVQQAYAGVSGFVEEISPADLIADAIRINSASLGRHKIDVQCELEQVPPIRVAKQKLLQIIVNLLSNAKYAVMDAGAPSRHVTVRLSRPEAGRVRLEISDTGVGIPAENLTRIFAHGFTTRKDGHGFGLHSAAILAGELGGTLAARSEGPGRGATFTLEIPTAAAQLSDRQPTPVVGSNEGFAAERAGM